MISQLNSDELLYYLTKQINTFFPDGQRNDNRILKKSINNALERCEYCFKHIKNEQYYFEGNVLFSHLHADQYATFLYFTSNCLWINYSDKNTCDKLLNLQRVLHGFFLSYKCQMPDIFYLNHPIGSIIGNAIYSDGLCISQNVTINTHKDKNGCLDLKVGKGVFFAPGAKVIGNGEIGNRVSIGMDVIVYDKKIDDDKVVINENGNLVVRDRLKKNCLAESLINMNFYN